jgi:hypothetical protein
MGNLTEPPIQVKHSHRRFRPRLEFLGRTTKKTKRTKTTKSMSAPARGGAMQLAEGPLQRLDFPFVIDLLALGEFERFQHQLHLLERAPQFFDDLTHLIDSLADRGSRLTGFRFPSEVRFGAGGGRSGFGHGALFGSGGRGGARPAAAPGMAAAAVPRPARFLRGRRLGRVRCGIRFFVWGHTHLQIARRREKCNGIIPSVRMLPNPWR